jgi:glycosyltransferase involved in cell wall biosynthesis
MPLSLPHSLPTRVASEIRRPRILYLDVPFAHLAGGDKNRSRFLWEALRTRFDVEVALIGRPGPALEAPTAWFQPDASTPFHRTSAAPTFGREAREGFARLVAERGYSAVFARFCTGFDLLGACASRCPDTPLIVDVDMLASRLAALAWRANPSLRNRWFLFEKWKAARFERSLYRMPWLFLLSNPLELDLIRTRHRPPGQIALLPNAMPSVVPPSQVRRARSILYFGSMDSAANGDGFSFLMDEVLPRVEGDLRRTDTRIRVVGKNPPAAFAERARQAGRERVEIVGAVDSMADEIGAAQFVLLPLRVASGTRTRILEAAALGRAVVTTPLGGEGLGLDDAMRVGDTADELARHIRALLADPAEADREGRDLQARSRALYATERIADEACRLVEGFVRKGRLPRRGGRFPAALRR